MNRGEKISVVIVFVILAIWIPLFPVLTIWSLNALFNIGIEVNWRTWAAAGFLVFLFSAPKMVPKGKKS